MTGRLTLVVGSQCDRLARLSFVEDYAGQLYQALESAGWRSARDGGGLLLNPSNAMLKNAVEDAFVAANEAESTLLVAFVGHGVARGTHDFYLMGTDAPAERPNSDKAFHFTQFVRERLQDFSSLDGLVFLVDACQAGEGAKGAATRWTDVLAENRSRAELLVASGTGSAYDGCFTRTILQTIQDGLPTRGDALVCGDFQPLIAENCLGQAQYLAYSGADPGYGDRGLWLVPNIARWRDAVTTRPAAGLVDQLTDRLLITDTVRHTLATIEESPADRLRLLVGAPGAGKSTLLAILIRPKLVDTLNIRDGYIKAAVFLDKASTLESMAAEISDQLNVTLDGFSEAVAAVAAELTEDDLKTLRVFDTAVRLPLARCKRAGLVAPIIVDGLDQPRAGAQEVILAAVQELTRATPADELGHVRVIAGVRSGEGIETREELARAHGIDIAAPTLGDIAAAISAQSGWRLSETQLAQITGDAPVGGWLIARLLAEIAGPGFDPPGFDTFGALITARIDRALRSEPSGTDRVLSVIAAAGDRPVLPIRLLAAALSEADADYPLARIRDSVVACGALVSRGNPGTDQETLGISHLAVLGAITSYNLHDLPATRAHQALLDAHQQRFSTSVEVGDRGESFDDVVAYWASAGPRHYLGSGHPEHAIAFLESLETARAADNRDRWASWLPEITTTLGPDHSATLIALHNLAYWRGESGDLAGAIADFEALLVDQLRVLGADHPGTLNTRGNLAGSRGESGDLAAAIVEFETLLADQLRVLGADHWGTLKTRGNLASWRGLSGDLAGAIADFEALLVDQLRVLGADHADTLTTRGNLAGWRGESGDVAGAIAELEALSADQMRLLGPDQLDTLNTRGNLAGFQGRSGDVPRAIAGLNALLDDLLRVVGPDHPTTLRIRGDLADWRGRSGDARAIPELDALLDDELRVLGQDHPAPFRTRSKLANLRGLSGNVAGAIADFEALLSDRVRALGPDHLDTLNTRRELAHWRGKSGDVAGAIARFESLLDDLVRVLEPDHSITLSIRVDLAGWHLVRAISDMEVRLADRIRALGADHHVTLRIRSQLAKLRGLSGDAARAIADFEALLTDQLRVLGADHLDTLNTRGSLAGFRGRGDVPQAIAELNALLDDLLRVVGPDHLATLTTRCNLAGWRAESGDVAGAIGELESLLADSIRVLGSEHPSTVAFDQALAHWRAVRERVGGAGAGPSG